MPETKKDNLVVRGLLDRRTVVVNGRILPESMDELLRELLLLQAQSSDPINMIVDSGGGSAHAALKVCDVMQSLITAPIRGIALGSCGSAATFLFLHCDERVSLPHAQFLLHSGTMNNVSVVQDETTATQIEQLLESIKTWDKLIVDMYMKQLKKSRTEIKALFARGDQRFNRYLTAEQAKGIGLVDSIVEEDLGIFPS